MPDVGECGNTRTLPGRTTVTSRSLGGSPEQSPAVQPRSTARLARGIVVVLLVVPAFLAYSLPASHERYRGGAIDDLQNLTLSLDRYFFARIQSADLVLQAAAQ